VKANEFDLKQKAGVIPYYINEEGKPVMMFMVPSNPKYGGSQFQIAKGRVEPGENLQQGAVREAEEELGLIESNIKQIKSLGTSTLTGLDETYLLTVFIAEIKNPTHFGQPHYETGKREWLTLEQFRSVGRANQLPVVTKAQSYSI